jgi:hypothetical protein
LPTIWNLGKILIDVTFDVRTDSRGKDPDTASATLKSFHAALWSKPLPDGSHFQLEDAGSKYLLAIHKDGALRVTSDTISNSMSGHKRLAPFLSELPEQLIQDVKDLGSTVGARIVFPGDRVNGKPTINVARGFHPRIKDRFDLTLECIRLHYQGEESPLSGVLARYRDYFAFFESFEGFVDFFLLQDLVNNGAVKFFIAADSPFEQSPYPQDALEYERYANKTLEFLAARNNRIQSRF